MEPAQVMKELGLTEHKLRFTSSVTMETSVPHHMFVERTQCELERLETQEKLENVEIRNGISQNLVLLQAFIPFAILSYNY